MNFSLEKMGLKRGINISLYLKASCEKKIDIFCVALECRKEYIWNMFKYVQSLGFKEM